MRRKNGTFFPGQSGNPGGRRKLTDDERDALDVIRDNLPKLVRIGLQKAVKGDYRFWKVMLDKAIPDVRSIEIYGGEAKLDLRALREEAERWGAEEAKTGNGQ